MNMIVCMMYVLQRLDSLEVRFSSTVLSLEAPGDVRGAMPASVQATCLASLPRGQRVSPEAELQLQQGCAALSEHGGLSQRRAGWGFPPYGVLSEVSLYIFKGFRAAGF